MKQCKHCGENDVSKLYKQKFRNGKVNNVVYEVYEKHHFNKRNMEKDLIREDSIINKLKCAFVKIIDGGVITW